MKRDKIVKPGKLAFDWSAEDKLACYNTHPVLHWGNGSVYGGSAINPVMKKADIYVALESSARFTLSDPWEDRQITNIRFKIDDSYPPKAGEIPRFKKMVTYLCNQLQAGKTIHIGCIGGHGRTGLVLAAMAAEMGHKDAIQFVRQTYCTRAVESGEQVKFLEDNYGVDPAPANKTSGGEGLWKPLDDLQPHKVPKGKRAYSQFVTPTGTSHSAAHEVFPVASGRNLWKRYT